MANKTLFRSTPGPILPKADTVNREFAPAYRMESSQALAQYATTGCLNGTYYASAEVQLAEVLALVDVVDPEFVAKTAIYARQRGGMKDLPALLLATLSVRAPELLAATFNRVVDSSRMLRSFVQVMRSGVVGRKSLGSLPKRLVREWLDGRPDEQLFYGSVGNDPSLADIVKMVHPRPTTFSREVLYGYLIQRPVDVANLPAVVREWERFKADPTSAAVPKVPFQLLTSLELGLKGWAAIARNATWQMTRMNLNAFQRHGVFEIDGMVELVADRLRNPELVRDSRVFPYQLLMASRMTRNLPERIREALREALEVSLENVPRLEGRVWVMVDVSGSMSSPVTGRRRGSTTAVRCVDVAALAAAALKRANPGRVDVIPFAWGVVDLDLDPRDTVLTNAEKLAAVWGGGTNCPAPLRFLNEGRERGDLVVYVSDNQSWLDSTVFGHPGTGPTATMREWGIFKDRNPEARMICIDIQPYATTQAQERQDIVNVGGFSDQVFDLIADVSRGATGGLWVDRIEEIAL